MKYIKRKITMKSESTSKVKGVLKLVHPGRFVETHKKPITAAEVLEKNPRHSIARPDVFRNPWVVVNPDSMLRPGEVFFIVPNRKIYELMKVHRESHQHSPDRGDCHPRSPSPLKTSCIWTTSQQQECSKRLGRHRKGECLKVTSKYTNNHREHEEESSQNAPLNIRSSHQDESLSNNGNLDDKITKEVTPLKSCLRRHDSFRKSLKLRVSFDLPNKDEKQERTAEGFEREFAGYHSCNCNDFFNSIHKHCPCRT